MNDISIPNTNTAHMFVYIIGWCFYQRAENTPFFDLQPDEDSN